MGESGIYAWSNLQAFYEPNATVIEFNVMRDMLDMRPTKAKSLSDSKSKLVALGERIQRWHQISNTLVDDSMIRAIIVGVVDPETQTLGTSELGSDEVASSEVMRRGVLEFTNAMGGEGGKKRG